MNVPDFACRVCGLLHGAPPWGEDGKLPLFEICECCGVEFGYEDCTVASTKRYRERWIEGGCVWFTPEERPADWDFEAQIVNVP